MSVGEKSVQRMPLIVACKEALRETCRLHEIKQDYLAAYLQVDKATISRWLDPEQPQWPGWEQWERLVGHVKNLTGSLEPLRPLANWFGGEIYGRPEASDFAINAHTLGRIATVLASKFGKVFPCLIQVLEDGQVDSAEEEGLHELEAETRALMIASQELYNRCMAQKAARSCSHGRPA